MLTIVFKDGRKEKATMQSNGFLMFEDDTELNMYELEAVGGKVEIGNKYTSIEEYNDIYTTGGTGKGSRKVDRTYTIKFRGSDKKIIFNFEIKGKIAELRKYINEKNFKVFKNN